MVVQVTREGAQVRGFTAELDPANPDFTAAADVGEFAGQTLTVSLAPLPPKPGQPVPPAHANIDDLLQAITQSDELPNNGSLYQEALRPQFHFSSKIGWNNDPNGLIYHNGQYFLFYQHNPFGWNHGNMHWGLAVSRDLVHWVELDEALFPDESGTMYSGSGVVDHDNSAGLQVGSEKTLICFYTAAGGTSTWSAEVPFTQCIAYSTDGGKSWQKYTGNPVLGHVVAINRDPKVVRHEPSGKWVMALYLENTDFALFGSSDLLKWERLCDVSVLGDSECPDFFELPVDGNSAEVRWVFSAASGNYLIGSFDGKTFSVESGPHRVQYGSSYAAQSWSDIPTSDGRRIQIAWLRDEKPGMPFSQQMSFPIEMSLRATPDGVRMFAEPVQELATIRGRQIVVDSAQPAPADLGELLEIRLAIHAPTGTTGGTATLRFRGVSVVWDRAASTLTLGDRGAPLPTTGETLSLQLLVDRSSVELFANNGAVAISAGRTPSDQPGDFELHTDGATFTLGDIEIFELKSIWS